MIIFPIRNPNAKYLLQYRIMWKRQGLTLAGCCLHTNLLHHSFFSKGQGVKIQSKVHGDSMSVGRSLSSYSHRQHRLES